MITEVKSSVEKDQKIKSNRKAYLEKEITKMATKSEGYQAEIDAITAWEGKVNPELSKVMSEPAPMSTVATSTKKTTRKK